MSPTKESQTKCENGQSTHTHMLHLQNITERIRIAWLGLTNSLLEHNKQLLMIYTVIQDAFIYIYTTLVAISLEYKQTV